MGGARHARSRAPRRSRARARSREASRRHTCLQLNSQRRLGLRLGVSRCSPRPSARGSEAASARRRVSENRVVSERSRGSRVHGRRLAECGSFPVLRGPSCQRRRARKSRLQGSLVDRRSRREYSSSGNQCGPSCQLLLAGIRFVCASFKVLVLRAQLCDELGAWKRCGGVVRDDGCRSIST